MRNGRGSTLMLTHGAATTFDVQGERRRAVAEAAWLGQGGCLTTFE